MNVLPLPTKPIRALLDQHSAKLFLGNQNGQPLCLSAPNSTGDYIGAINALEALMLSQLTSQRRSDTQPKGSNTAGLWTPLFFKRPWVVVVQQSWARNFCCVWHPALRSMPEYQRYAALEFERRFGITSTDWAIELDNPLPNRSSLVCAFPNSLSQRLSDLFARLKQPLLSLRSFAFAELDICLLAMNIAKPKAGRLQFVGSGIDTRPAMLIDKGRITEFTLVPSSTAQNNMSESDLISILLKTNGVEPKAALARAQVVYSNEQMQSQVLCAVAQPGSTRLEHLVRQVA